MGKTLAEIMTGADGDEPDAAFLFCVEDYAALLDLPVSEVQASWDENAVDGVLILRNPG